jgi:hypothetical protein
MVRRFTTLRARMLAMLAACVWAWTGLASELHEFVVLHTVCVEHNEVVEVGPPSASDAVAHHGHQLVDGATPQHDHGCVIHPVFRPTSATPPCAAQRGIRIRLVEAVAAHAPVPAQTPLDYAPKTSPPSVG